MMRASFVLLFLPALLLAGEAGRVRPMAADVDPERPLRTLRAKHPRLIALDPDIERIRATVKSDPVARRYYEQIKQEAEQILPAPPVAYRLVGPRLLGESRRAVSRIYTLALMYRLDGDKRYLERAVRELKAAAEFPDWNPSHFLDTAEMTHAFAIGYDWLYGALQPEDRAWIRRAIVEKGIAPAMKVYERPRGWHTAVHNWNQVCNGGIGIGALAIGDEEPKAAEAALVNALRSIPKAMASYAPDGGWNEGPGYWHYATRYNVYFLAALESALGTDFGLSGLPGFSGAGRFRIYFSSPTGYTFNYADAGSSAGSAAEMFWLASRFSQPVFAWQQIETLKNRGRAEPLDLIWYHPGAISPRDAGWPLDAYFTGVQTAFMRSSWDDPNAIFVAIKGGDNKANHSHLDLGSFVLDAGGVRWAEDLGGDNYNLPNYFGDKRWTYFRLRTESHNTILIDNENQDPKAAAKVIEHRLEPQRAYIRIDLTAAYPGRVTKLERTLALEDRKRVIVEDVVEAPRPVEALWSMMTPAGIQLDGRRAVLSQQGRRLRAEIRSPQGALFEVLPAQPPPPQNQNKGRRRLVVRLPEKTASTRIVVALTE